MEKIQKPYIAMICTDGDAGVCMVLPGHVQARPVALILDSCLVRSW